MRAQNHEILKQSVLTNTEFTHLLKPIYNDAVNYCRALCAGQQMAEAEEIMQQSLLKAYENIDSLNDLEKFKSWFFRLSRGRSTTPFVDLFGNGLCANQK